MYLASHASLTHFSLIVQRGIHSLSETEMVVLSAYDNKGWGKWLIACWALMECILFSGILYGWGSLVFVLKDEGLYTDLCHVSKSETSRLNLSNSSSLPSSTLGRSMPVSMTTITSTASSIDVANGEARLCEQQEDNLALCFTIASALFLFNGAVLGYINLNFGTRISRIYSL